MEQRCIALYSKTIKITYLHCEWEKIYIKTVYKDDAEERRSRRIAGPYPVGDISFSGWQEGIVSLPYQILSFRCLDSTLESVRLLSFCFHLITDVKGLYPFLLLQPPSSTLGPPTFSPYTSFSLSFSPSLYYSFIYSNYLHDVNLSLPLISLPSHSFHGHSAARRRLLARRSDC